MSKNATDKADIAAEAKKEIKFSLESYFEALAENTDKMAEGFAAMRESNTRVMNQFVESVTSGQKDLIELGRTMAAQPADYKSNMQHLLDTMNRRQACALELGKTMYREQSEMSGALTERMEKLFEPMKSLNTDWSAPYKKMAEYWIPSAK
jgi:2,4-dienoyl-CoA reductase-like NADH-dependent reductase (Old Yellow Enzyme family)